MKKPLALWQAFRITLCYLFLIGFLVIAGGEAEVFSADVSLPPVPGIWNPDPVANNAPSSGSAILSNGIKAAVEVIRLFLGMIAIIWITWSGIQIIFSGGNEESVKNGKRGITWALLGLVFSLVLDIIIFDILDLRNLTTPELINTAAKETTLLVLNALSWFQSLIIIAAVAFLLISGWNMISAFGDTEKISQQKTVLTWVGVGVVVILLNEVLVKQVLYPYMLSGDGIVKYSPDAARGIHEITAILRYFLGFLAVISLAILVYGGGLWISAFGDEERIESGKKTVRGAIIGIIIILTSYALVATFVSGQIGGSS
ncbi:hypothetical protein IPN35_04350 [Candidatus Peregrinibacteria bacterium]|nr:MAG: hypothetical protein IPN35_04350 [Candidatus Peregrinibacteria bacterium]